ncbi:hypothetical protein ACH4NT_04170 [Streptomyces lydicus]|uniref:hypothetical protein n=1 Tax=Streptomyces lydicus TaxID=47763 RepID=UPI00379E776A
MDRVTEFEHGMPQAHQAWDGNGWRHDPAVIDDQALVIHVHGWGLVILTGCGHAGVVNIIRHAMRLTGVSKLLALIGGFHPSGPAFEPVISPTMAALTELAPELIVPGHCTGRRAQHTLAAALPDAWVQTSVGTTYTLSAPRQRVMPDPGSAVPAQMVQQEVQRRRYANGCRGYLGWHPGRWKPAMLAASVRLNAYWSGLVAGSLAFEVVGVGRGAAKRPGEAPSEGIEEDPGEGPGNTPAMTPGEPLKREAPPSPANSRALL